MHPLARPSRAAHLPSRNEGARRKVAIVSTCPPRSCGIATFTHDVRQALTTAAPDLEVVLCALDRDGLSYGPDVAVVIDQDDRASYPAAARRLAAAGVHAVVIQHEFGIFGGPDGAWINDLADALHAEGVPYLVTLHTILSHPSRSQQDVLRRLCAGAAAVTTFTPTAARLAAAAGVDPAGGIHVLPHGAPDLLHAIRCGHYHPAPDTGVRPEVAALLASLNGTTLAATFGLVSPGKGLETAITAVADLAEQVPDLHYLIAGATHPEIVRTDGEDYRYSLHRLADDLRVADRIHFIDAFLTDAEIAAVLSASAVFLTPYRSAEQISSGALTFALAAGVPAVSTAYHYACDMLDAGAGRVVPVGDTGAFTTALHTLLTQPGALDTATAAARATGEHLAWPAIAANLADLIRTTNPIHPVTNAITAPHGTQRRTTAITPRPGILAAVG